MSITIHKNIPNLDNAILSTIAVLISFLFVQFYYGAFQFEHIPIIVAAQNIGGIYFGVANSIRMKVALQFSMIFILGTILGFSASNIFLAVPCIFLLSLAITYAFRFFPINAADMIIPLGLIFFLIAFSNISLGHSLLHVAQGCAIGLALQFVYYLIQFKKKLNFQQDIEAGNLEKIHWDFHLQKSEKFYILTLFLLLMIAYSLVQIFDLTHGYWICFTIVVLYRNSQVVTQKRVLQRVAGTLLGVIATMGIMQLHLPKIALLLIVLLANFFCTINVKNNYRLAVFFITIFVLIQSEYTGSLPISMQVERFIYTLIAGIIVYGLTLWQKRKTQTNLD